MIEPVADATPPTATCSTSSAYSVQRLLRDEVADDVKSAPAFLAALEQATSANDQSLLFSAPVVNSYAIVASGNGDLPLSTFNASGGRSLQRGSLKQDVDSRSITPPFRMLEDPSSVVAVRTGAAAFSDSLRGGQPMSLGGQFEAMLRSSSNGGSRAYRPSAIASTSPDATTTFDSMQPSRPGRQSQSQNGAGVPGTTGRASIRPYACDDCGKAFQNNSALVKHKLIHSDDRMHVCNVCMKAFKRQDHLTGHMNVHKQVKPFACIMTDCDKSYCDARSLRRHLEHGHSVANATVHSLKGTMYIRCGDGNEISVPMCTANTTVNGSVPSTTTSRERNSSGETTNSTISVQDISSPLSSNYGSEKATAPVKCTHCERTFKNVPALNGHMRLHSALHRPAPSSATDLPHPTASAPCDDGAMQPKTELVDERIANYVLSPSSPIAIGGCSSPLLRNVAAPFYSCPGTPMNLGGYAMPVMSTKAGVFDRHQQAMLNAVVHGFRPSPLPPNTDSSLFATSHLQEAARAQGLLVPAVPSSAMSPPLRLPQISFSGVPSSSPHRWLPPGLNRHLMAPPTAGGLMPPVHHSLAVAATSELNGLMDTSLSYMETSSNDGMSSSVRGGSTMLSSVANPSQPNSPMVVDTVETATALASSAVVNVDPRRSTGDVNCVASTSVVVGHSSDDPLAGLDMVGAVGLVDDDESIRKELDTLTALGVMGGDDDDDPFDSFGYGGFATSASPNGGPERRRHKTDPGARFLAERDRLMQQSSLKPMVAFDPAVTTSRAAVVPTSYRSTTVSSTVNLNPLRARRKSKGKPENVCQLLQAGADSAHHNSTKHRTRSGHARRRFSGTGGGRKQHSQPHSGGSSKPRCRSRPVFDTVGGNTAGPSSSMVASTSRRPKPPPLAIPHLNRYPSQLRSPRLWETATLLKELSGEGLTPYTPPPMLSPMRHGSGLYWNIRQLHGAQFGGEVVTRFRFSFGSSSGEPPKSAPIATTQQFWQRVTSVAASGSAAGQRQKQQLCVDTDEQSSSAVVAGGKIAHSGILAIRASTTADDANVCMEEVGASFQPDVVVDDATTSPRSSSSLSASQTVTFPVDISDDTDLSPPATDRTPHINCGYQYQADIPEMLHECTRANLPLQETPIFHHHVLDNLPTKKVDAYVDFVSSCCLKGGGKNVELALHLLHCNQGDIQASALQLLSGQHYDRIQQSASFVDTDEWTPAEIQRFGEALCKHEKDFFLVAQELDNKSTKQCVAFYYTWKKSCPDDYRRLRILRRKRQTAVELAQRDTELPVYNLRSNAAQLTDDDDGRHQNNAMAVDEDDLEDDRPCSSDDESMSGGAMPTAVRWTDDVPPKRRRGGNVRRPPPICAGRRRAAADSVDGLFHCTLCARAFEKVKSLNAHMKSHRATERSSARKFS